MDHSQTTVQLTRILVADDSDTIQKVVRIALGRQPVRVEAASSWPEAEIILQSGIAVLLLDPNLPGIDSSEEKIREVIAAAGKTPVLAMLGSHERSISDEALKNCGVFETIQKPFDSTELVVTVMGLAESRGAADASFGSHTGSQSAAVPPPPKSGSRSAPPPPPPSGFTMGVPESNPGQAPTPRQPEPPSGFDSDVNQETQAELPPLPDGLVDATRKGKKAFDLNPENLFDLSTPETNLPPGPVGSGESNDGSFVDSSLDLPAAPQSSQIPDLDWASASQPVPVKTPPQSAAVPGQDELAREVRKAVEEYCAKNFRSLAIEVITAELRRLAEEKARHLVDI